MTGRVALAVLVVPALALVAMTARSYQPFGGDEGAGRRAPSSTFIDASFTVIATLAVVALLIAVWVWLSVRPTRARGAPGNSLLGLMLFLIVVTTLVAGRALLGLEPRRSNSGDGATAFPAPVEPGQKVTEPFPEAPQVVWPLAIGVAIAVLAIIAAIVVADRRRRRPGERTPEDLERLVRALDSAIEDLRREPDPRRAVVAAYARMEQALSYHGLPRRPPEAPYEYLARVGRELDAEEPVAELTELFEEAKFSEHSVDEGMRGRAIDALVSVRREVQAAT